MSEEECPQIGESTDISPDATVGHAYSAESKPPVIGVNGTIRSGTIIYNDTIIGDSFATGHYAIVREHTTIGDDVLVGTNVVIDGTTDIGSRVSLQTGVYIPSHTTIGNNVFIGPYAVLTNDPLPVREAVDLTGPSIEDDVSIGANATLLPKVTIGKGSFVAAGAVVTNDVPPNSLAIGVPASLEPLPKRLQGKNRL